MQPIHAHIEALTAHATAETTLLAVEAHRLQRFPDSLAGNQLHDHTGGTFIELARDDRVALRLLERQARLALRNPDRDLYHAHHPGAASQPGEWAILLAPRAAATRLYLSRVTHRRFYRPGEPIDAPNVAPGTLLAHWQSISHAFTHITTDEQKHRVLFASTADHHIHIALDAPATGRAIPFTPTTESRP